MLNNSFAYKEVTIEDYDHGLEEDGATIEPMSIQHLV
jgi:hypothetical protein